MTIILNTASEIRDECLLCLPWWCVVWVIMSKKRMDSDSELIRSQQPHSDTLHFLGTLPPFYRFLKVSLTKINQSEGLGMVTGPSGQITRYRICSLVYWGFIDQAIFFL
jgi:hypothetical protein